MARDIKQWQDSVLIEERTAPDGPDAPIFRLFTTANSLYSLLLRSIETLLPAPEFRRLEREHHRFLLWGDGYDVVSGNLDRVLADAKRMRHSTICFLVSICRTLAKGALKRFPDDSNSPELERGAIEAVALADSAIHTYCLEDDADELDGKPDADSPIPDGGLFKYIAEDLKTDVQCLIDLGPTYDEPAQNKGVQAKTAEEEAETITWDPASYLTDRLHHRFPLANINLVSLLGKSNWERYKRLSRSVQENNSREQRQVAQEYGAGYVTVRDSAIGTSISASSIPAGTAYAETVISYYGGSNGTSIRVPPIPVEGEKGCPFSCPLCGDSVSVKDKAAWKRHIMADLQPYTCIVISCDKSQIPYPDKKTWADHLQLEHGFFDSSTDDDSPACPFCQEPAVRGRTFMVSHLAQHLEEASLTILPANAESSDHGSSTGDGSSSTSIANGELRRRGRRDSKTSDGTPPLRNPSPNSDGKADRPIFPGARLSRDSDQPLASLTTEPSGPLPYDFQFTAVNSSIDDGVVPATTLNMLPVQSPRLAVSMGGQGQRHRSIPAGYRPVPQRIWQPP